VIVIDRVNRLNNLHYCEQIRCSNPCGEQMLPPYGACLLASINLAALIKHPFTADARLDEEEFDRLTYLGVRMMDNVVDVSLFPLPEQQAEAQAKRRIGLGVTGLADALIMCRTRYGSAEAIQLTESWMRRLQRQAYLASIELAKEKGAFPMFKADEFLAGENVQRLDEDIRDGIRQHGIRNALLTSIAPTGTISLLADNVSGGLEPVFSFTYNRDVTQPDGSKKTEEVSDYAYRLFRRLFGQDAELPEYFVNAQTLEPRDHLVMQAACQRYVDSSISKTINCPEDITFEAFKDVYLQSYELGCKGCTTYRPNDVTGSILSVKSETAADAPAPAEEDELPPADRPPSLEGVADKLDWPPLGAGIYLQMFHCRLPKSGRFVLYECFITTMAGSIMDWSGSTTRLISAIARHKPSLLRPTLEKLAQQQSPAGAWVGQEFVPSVVALVARRLLKRMDDLGAMSSTPAEAPPPVAAAEPVSLSAPANRVSANQLGLCPKCGSRTFRHNEGCGTCLDPSCNHTNCA
jgi:ribonucleoside-diphosphate reductase alpha chain